MPEKDNFEYELVDFGDGIKLEKLGTRLIQRPSPFARRTSLDHADVCNEITDQFVVSKSGNGNWIPDSENPWTIPFGPLVLEIRKSPQGQLGVFPEHAIQWRWMDRFNLRGKSILHLFGYTGATSLKLAHSGASVTHIDASKSAVQWARENAKHSNLTEAPIRWIVEDAVKFVSREVKRGNKYDGIVVDPPSFGRGPEGQVWKLEKHLDDLLSNLAKLLVDDATLLLLTSHTLEFDNRVLQQKLEQHFQMPGGFESGKMSIPSSTGKKLGAGWFARNVAPKNQTMTEDGD